MYKFTKLTSYLCIVPISAISLEKFKLDEIPIDDLKIALNMAGLAPETANFPQQGRSTGFTRELVPNEDYSSFDLSSDDTNIQNSIEYSPRSTSPVITSQGPVAYRAMLQAAFMGINIDNYGCWCIFGDNRDKARGPTMNNVDRLCKSLQRGYDCVMIDQENDNNNDSCIPWDVDYKFDFTLIGDIPTMCQTANPNDNCKIRSCMVEMKFTLSYLSEVFSGTINTDDQFSHTNNFDFNNVCKRVHNDVNPEKACCGDYPERYSYRTIGGDRSCCVNKTYNTQIFTCCADGSISMSMCG